MVLNEDQQEVFVIMWKEIKNTCMHTCMHTLCTLILTINMNGLYQDHFLVNLNKSKIYQLTTILLRLKIVINGKTNLACTFFDTKLFIIIHATLDCYKKL